MILVKKLSKQQNVDTINRGIEIMQKLMDTYKLSLTQVDA